MSASISPPLVVRHPSAPQPWIIPAIVWGECDCSSTVQSGQRCNKDRSHCRIVFRSCKTHKCTVSASTSVSPTITTNGNTRPIFIPATRVMTTVHHGESTTVMVQSDTDEMSAAPVKINTTNVLIGGLVGGLALLALVIVVVVISKLRRTTNRPEEDKDNGHCKACLPSCYTAEQPASFDDPVYVPPEVVPQGQQERQSMNNLAYDQTIPALDGTDEVQHDYEEVHPDTSSTMYQHLNRPHTSGADGHPGVTILKDDDGRYSTVEIDSVLNAENDYSTIKFTGESRRYFELEESDQTNPSRDNTSAESENGVFHGVSPAGNFVKTGATSANDARDDV